MDADDTGMSPSPALHFSTCSVPDQVEPDEQSNLGADIAGGTGSMTGHDRSCWAQKSPS